MPVSLSRQIATGAAAFVLTAALLLAHAAERDGGRLPLDRRAVSSQILTVLTRHG